MARITTNILYIFSIIVLIAGIIKSNDHAVIMGLIGSCYSLLSLDIQSIKDMVKK